MSFKDGNKDEEVVQIFMDSRTSAEIAQLGERQTEDLQVPGSIPGFDWQIFRRFLDIWTTEMGWA